MANNKNMKKIIKYSITLLSLSPLVVFGATKATLSTLISKIVLYANNILLLLVGIAIVMFVFYVIKYFIKADSNRAEGGQYVMYSLIGFFVILSFWGLVNILQNTFDLGNDTNRPASWTSLLNLFPGGNNGYTKGTQQPPLNTQP
jgi:hypothetical protein